MEFNKLEKYKNQFKALASKIGSVQSFLELKLSSGPQGTTTTPYEVSARTGIDEMAALFILNLAEKEHIIQKQYAVFSDNDTLIAEYGSQDEIPAHIEDPSTGKDIDSEHYYIEPFYQIPNHGS